jgi:hypothetical protein
MKAGCEAAQTVPARGRMMVPLVKGASIMKLILCAALVAASGAASAVVNKCVDPEGHVLLTDLDCPVSTQLITEQERPAEVSTRPPVLPPVVSPAPRSRWADLPRPLIRKSVSLDAATLQAARQNLLLQDELHKPRRLLSSR